MPTRFSAVLIAIFLLTVFVFMGRTTSAPDFALVTPASTENAAATPEVTEAATAEAAAASTETALAGDPVRGKMIFEKGLNGAPACKSCHATAPGYAMFALAPNLKGIADRAARRIPGMSAAQYIEDSIRYPSDFIVSGFHVSMYPDFDKDYTDQDIADLVAYLMML